jgi:uncharacterized protein YbjQ (UPF0145 family)
MGILIYFVWFIFILALAYFVGTFIEKTHYQEIKKREDGLLYLPAVSSKAIEAKDNILNGELVYGSVVVSLDYFKRFLAGLRNIFGGRIKSYESLIDRGRREAILRMKEKARAMSADIILNMRFQTSTIGQVTAQKGSVGCVEVLVYGTAVKLKNK